ncbi:immunoglobulin superfamily containing leucine-rich repeat protein 2-like [Ambystoma mexicanum]|uniref:immunoglobulin superfamily containing leucine-rich repeat protein 2-like n=1 Tax=Ambystoma mexicanum TaxID=8296 RepID=UPI0037E7A02F
MEPLLLVIMAAFLSRARGCPAPCACVDKYNQQFADCAYKDLQVVPTGFPSNVTTLSLSANKITTLKKDYFVEVTQVTSLWLAHNEISLVAKGTLAILVQLKNLDISHNQIVDFPWGDLASLTALQLLKMNNNRMTNLPWDAFQNLKDLRSLRINNNNFATIAEGTFDALRAMSHLQIYNNPFNCTCSLLWLKNWTENTLISIPEQESIACASPPILKDTPVGKIPNLQCSLPSVQLTYHPNLDTTELFDGLMLLLHCNATGSPQPAIKWKIQTYKKDAEVIEPNLESERNDLPLQLGKPTKDRFLAYRNGTLVIPHLSKREEGTYTCRATNELGSNQTSVNVAVAGGQKYPLNPKGDPELGKTPLDDKNPGTKSSKNNVINLASPEEKTKVSIPTRQSYTAGSERSGGDTVLKLPPYQKKCGPSDTTQYISNHAFNQSSDLKQHAFDLGVIALDVSEREAKVQLTPFSVQPDKVHLRILYLCKDSGQGHSLVQWSKIEEGVNSYWFQNLVPGTNYSVCMTYVGEDCQVQVVFTTKIEIPSLIIIIVVSIFLLGLATIPLLGATCCHLLSKYHGKTYKLFMKTQNNQDQMEKHMAADFDPRASYLESEKNYDPSETGDAGVEVEEEEGEGEVAEECSIVAESIPESQSKTNQEEFEVGSEYSDRLPLGAEAVTISQEINGNYNQPAR